MARGRSTFRQQDITRAMRAMAAAGRARDVRRVEIDPDGKIILVMIEYAEDEPGNTGTEIVL
jgi:hypothetical protein